MRHAQKAKDGFLLSMHPQDSFLSGRLHTMSSRRRHRRGAKCAPAILALSRKKSVRILLESKGM